MSTASMIDLTRAKSAFEVKTPSRATVFTDKLRTLAARVQLSRTLLPDRAMKVLVTIANTLKIAQSWSTETRVSPLAGTSRPSTLASPNILGSKLATLRSWSKKVYVQNPKMEVSQAQRSIGTLIKAVSNPKQISHNVIIELDL